MDVMTRIEVMDLLCEEFVEMFPHIGKGTSNFELEALLMAAKAIEPQRLEGTITRQLARKALEGYFLALYKIVTGGIDKDEEE